MHTKTLAAAALLALGGAAAQAAAFDLSTGPFSFEADKTTTADFTDVYNFTGSGILGLMSSSLIETKLSDKTDIDWSDSLAFAVYNQWDGGGTLLASYGDPAVGTGSFAIEDLSVPSMFSIVVQGRAIGTGLNVFQPGLRGTYDLSVVAQPVPEPSSVLLMLGGLGGIGFLSLRRKAASRGNR